MRSNRETVDDPGTQIMTMVEIEALKAEGTGSGKDLISKILDSHSALDKKTAFALAKYTLRKEKKYMKRFTVLPLDVPLLSNWILTEKEPMKIMELREESVALIGSWSNVHFEPSVQIPGINDGDSKARAGRWLMVDETGGLLVAAMAEKLRLLDMTEADMGPEDSEMIHLSETQQLESGNGDLGNDASEGNSLEPTPKSNISQKPAMPIEINTITLIHANSQPNLSLLKYFHFDSSNPNPAHPLTGHLKTLSWLQLISPDDDVGYNEPETLSNEVLQSWKSGKRGNYYRKRRRWERTKYIVDETRAGGFDGLIVASVMSPVTILHHVVPLLRGAAQVVVYSPTIESLAELADYYSSARRTAFATETPDPTTLPSEDFPVDPTLLLAPTIQTARCRSWQVLPGRTHPLMTGRGGSEGYIFTATRVLPAEGKVEARGRFKRRKLDDYEGKSDVNLQHGSMDSVGEDSLGSDHN